MKRKDGDVTRSDEGRETYRNASEASAGTMESLRGALLGIVPGIKEAAAWDEDDELSTAFPFFTLKPYFLRR